MIWIFILAALAAAAVVFCYALMAAASHGDEITEQLQQHRETMGQTQAEKPKT